jgi:hypothetical protein
LVMTSRGPRCELTVAIIDRDEILHTPETLQDISSTLSILHTRVLIRVHL